MACLKRLVYIFIPILAILLMSHNAKALSFGNSQYYSFRLDRMQVSVTNNEYTSYLLPESQMSLLNSGLNISIPTNTIRVNNIHLGLTAYTPAKYLANVAYRFCPVNPDNLTSWIGFAGSTRNSIISQSWIINGSCLSGEVLLYGDSAANRIDLGLGDNAGVNIGYIAAGGTIVFNSVSTIELTDDADYSSVLNAIKNNTDDIKTKLDEIADSADAALDREQSETQDAADDSSSAGSSSSSDATAATSSLISVIGGFVNVLTSAQPTNCKINANLNHIDMGQLDLCANPVPSYIQIIGSIILICAAIPLAIVLFNRFIGLFRSFQG